MRTSVVIEDALLDEAFRLTKIKTKKELIQRALEELIERRKMKDLRKIKGKIQFRDDYDYKAMRE